MYMNTYGGFHKVGFSLKLKFGPMSCFQFSRDPWTRVDNVRRYILYVVPTYRAYVLKVQVPGVRV